MRKWKASMPVCRDERRGRQPFGFFAWRSCSCCSSRSSCTHVTPFCDAVGRWPSTIGEVGAWVPPSPSSSSKFSIARPAAGQTQAWLIVSTCCGILLTKSTPQSSVMLWQGCGEKKRVEFKKSASGGASKPVDPSVRMNRFYTHIVMIHACASTGFDLRDAPGPPRIKGVFQASFYTRKRIKIS